jgi:hypothetical protein
MHEPHGSEEHRRIANEGLILKVLVGSGVHGTALEGTDDTDYMGICIEPPLSVIGVGEPLKPPFQQYQYRSAAERTGDMHARSGPGDVDEVVYSLRKWLRLAMGGNPTVLLPLFTPEEHIVAITDWGLELRRVVPRFAPSKAAGERFLGYMVAQREKLLGLRSTQTNRPELVSVHGFDTKFAMHMIRLGLQGVEYLETGRITLPIPEPDRTWLVQMRRGAYSRDEALERAEELEARLRQQLVSSGLPDHPDWKAANRWLVDTYQAYWSGLPPGRKANEG